MSKGMITINKDAKAAMEQLLAAATVLTSAHTIQRAQPAKHTNFIARALDYDM